MYSALVRINKDTLQMIYDSRQGTYEYIKEHYPEKECDFVTFISKIEQILKEINSIEDLQKRVQRKEVFVC